MVQMVLNLSDEQYSKIQSMLSKAIPEHERQLGRELKKHEIGKLRCELIVDAFVRQYEGISPERAVKVRLMEEARTEGKRLRQLSQIHFTAANKIQKDLSKKKD